MNKPRRAFTVIEILVVIAIIGLLVATLSLLLGPVIRARAIETRIKSDLHQISAGINLYTADNDGDYPPDIDSLSATVPREYPGWPSRSPYARYETDGKYMLLYNEGAQRIDRNGGSRLKYPFDPAKYAVADAPFYQRATGKKTDIEFFTGPGTSTIRRGKQDEVLVLGTRMDGSVYWKPYWEQWQFEHAANIGLLRN